MERTISSPQAYSCVSISVYVTHITTIATNLGGKELRGRVPAGIVGGNVDEAVHVVLGDSLGDALSAVNVHVGVGEVPELPLIDHSSFRKP
jgi:hypothetical protein